MMSAGDAIYPVYQLMADHGQGFDPSAYLPSVVGYYTDPEGNMLSMPFNSSTPIMWYNRDIFEAAGLDPDSPPTTWPELLDAARLVVESGAAECGFTTTWQSWVMIENFSAWHNLPIATLSNGFEGFGTEMVFNSEAHVAHISALADAAEEGIFTYGGRQSAAGELFTSETCAITFGSSAGYAGYVASGVNFDNAQLPYWPSVTQGPDGGPQNSIIGGATLWVLSGATDAEYEGVAAFLNYLSSPEVQAEWHQATGYLPITFEAAGLSLAEGFYANNPGTDTAILQMFRNEPTDNSRGLRFGYMVQIRDVINEELESVWAGDKTAQEALDSAVERSNELLRTFEDDLS
jgi:sn-glycerol 3-phosphate transport system substrate-binding protein